MKNYLLIFCLITILASCKKDVSNTNVVNNTTEKNSAAVSADYGLVWFGNGDKVQVYNGSSGTDWNGAPHFDFQPSTARGYSSSDLTNWGGPSDFKVRHMPIWGGNWMVTSGGSLAVVAGYPSGEKRWTFSVGSGVNPHSAELLPSGNVAVAGTDGNWVRVYAASVGAYNYDSYYLEKSHSVLWDPTINKLWAIGLDHLVALTVTGTGTPVITQSEKITLPRPLGADKPSWGHDMSFDPNNSDIIWFTLNGGVYSYNKVTKAAPVKGPGQLGTMIVVKGISRQANGTFVVTRPDGAKNPIPSNPAPDWYTRFVEFFDASGSPLYTKTKTGAMIYKGKTLEVTPPAAPIANGKYKITSRLNATKALTVSLASTTTGANVVLYDYTSGSNNNDEWNLTKIGTTGYYRITNVHSSLDLVVSGASYANGANIIQHNYTSANPVNDEWSIESVGSGYYRIVSRYSSKVLNVFNSSTTNGTQIIQWPYSNVTQSQWLLTLIP